MHQRKCLPWTAGLLVVPLLVAYGSSSAAEEPAAPEDERWNRPGNPPKRLGPRPRSIGIVLGYQTWTGLGDLATQSEGSYDETTMTIDLTTTFFLWRRDKTDVGVGFDLGYFRHDTDEPIGGSDDVTLTFWRLGVTGRACYHRESRVQPTIGWGLGVLLGEADVHTPFQSVDRPLDASFDLWLSAGVELPLTERRAGGWRVRTELQLDYFAFDDPVIWPRLGQSPEGPVLRAQVGFFHKRDVPEFGKPKTPPGTSPAQGLPGVRAAGQPDRSLPRPRARHSGA
jgi:hypothetical protein